MRRRQNRHLLAWFAGYAAAVGALFLLAPRLTAQPHLLPWDYWWVFLLVTPAAAVAVLALGVRAGRFSGWAVGLFYLAVALLGLWRGWFSHQLAAVV